MYLSSKINHLGGRDMNYKFVTGLVAAAVLGFAGAAQADTTAFNATPTDTWFFGTGNDYAPANTLVLTTDAGDQLYLRAHQTHQVAPASTGDTYTFPTGLDFISFDWGFDSHTGSADGLTALITLTNFAGGTFSYNPLGPSNDNELLNGSTQNSARLNWFPIGFDPSVDGSYGVRLAVNGLDGGPKSVNIRVDVGNGVPEPASWALMIMGFAGAGAFLRRRRASLAAGRS